MNVRRAYKYALQPTDSQKKFFARTFGCTRKIFNLMLHDWKEEYDRVKGTKEKAKLTTPAEYKEEYEYLKEVDSLSLANAQQQLKTAYQNFFRKPKEVGYPKFKSKNKDTDSYTTNNQKGTIAIIDDTYIRLPKIGLVPIVYHRNHTGLIKSATVTRDKTGKYFVSVLCETWSEPLPKKKNIIGIDMGLEHFLILSDGSKMENPRFLEQDLMKLKKEQRKLSKKAEKLKKQKRKLSECKNYQKQKKKVATIHKKIRNRRADFLHKLSTYIVKNHDIICIENLSVKEMQQSRMARAIADAGWSMFLSMLKNKGYWYGKTIMEMDKYYPSSQLCSNCNTKDGKKELNVRTWTCPVCGSVHDRDINAAKNIRKEGLIQYVVYGPSISL